MIDATHLQTVGERLAAVRGAIAGAAREAGRPGEAVTLVAVSKTVEARAIEEAIAAGQRDFGENRVQEAMGKWPSLLARFPDVRLHLIGPLQSNKAADALALFDVLHTVDRDKIAALLGAGAASVGRARQFFVQVNTGGEPQKAGVPPQEAGAFVERCRSLHHLPVAGLMCIPPAEENPAPHFALLAKLGREAGVGALSMGMSGDFATAIALGATHVRVGSAIFGARPAAG